MPKLAAGATWARSEQRKPRKNTNVPCNTLSTTDKHFVARLDLAKHVARNDRPL
jgi:hypothetical protein